MSAADNGRLGWLDAAQPHDCATCRGFQYEQRTPGRFTVCAACRGSGRDDVAGTRRPGLVVRDSASPDPDTLAGFRLAAPDTARAAHRRRARPPVTPPTRKGEPSMPRTPESAARERERKRRNALQATAANRAQRGEAEAPPPPVEAEPPIDPVAEPLAHLVAELARRANAAAARVEAAGADLAGTNGGSGANDLWRFSAEVQRARADLAELDRYATGWRQLREAEVSAAAEVGP